MTCHNVLSSHHLFVSILLYTIVYYHCTFFLTQFIASHLTYLQYTYFVPFFLTITHLNPSQFYLISYSSSSSCHLYFIESSSFLLLTGGWCCRSGYAVVHEGNHFLSFYCILFYFSLSISFVFSLWLSSSLLLYLSTYFPVLSPNFYVHQWKQSLSLNIFNFIIFPRISMQTWREITSWNIGVDCSTDSFWKALWVLLNFIVRYLWFSLCFQFLNRVEGLGGLMKLKTENSK